MFRIRTFPHRIKELDTAPGTVRALQRQADTVSRRVSAPSHLRISTRSGVGSQGAYSQVRMHGRGAVAIEFGGRNNAPMAPLRKALGNGGY